MTPIPGTPDLSRADDDGMAISSGVELASRSIPVHEQDSLRAIRSIVDTLSPASLGALISLANGRLPAHDPLKIRMAEVKSLRRLAAQAHALDSSMLDHALERRRLGDTPADVFPEAANTAIWTDRLIRALEGILRRYD